MDMPHMLRYAKLSPAGNTTAIIADPVAAHVRPGLSLGLMDALAVEQVGFWTPPGGPIAAARLHMMGGEFCGNAARCMAALLAMGGADLWRHGPRPVAAPMDIPLEISGHSGILRAAVSAEAGAGVLQVTADMPVPTAIRHGAWDGLGDYSAVTFEGITHLVLWHSPPGESAEAAALALAARLGLGGGDLGLMFTDLSRRAMTPLVLVAAVGSRVWERSCGSGTVAVACAQAHRTGRPVEALALRQPGGTLTACARPEGTGVAAASLSGTVALVSFGSVI